MAVFQEPFLNLVKMVKNINIIIREKKTYLGTPFLKKKYTENPKGGGGNFSERPLLLLYILNLKVFFLRIYCHYKFPIMLNVIFLFSQIINLWET